MGPMQPTASQGDHSSPEPQPGPFIVFVWSMLVTLILVGYIVISLILYTEERNYRQRQQELIDSWRAGTLPMSPPSSSSPNSQNEWRGRDPERTALMHYEEYLYGDLVSSDSDSTEEGSNVGHNSGDAYGHGYGSTDAHPPFNSDEPSHVEARSRYLLPPYSSPVSPAEDAILSQSSTLVELPNNETHAEAGLEEMGSRISSPKEPFTLRDRQDSSGITASGPSESPSHSVHLNTDSEEQALLSPQGPAAEGEHGSFSSSSNSRSVLDGHELVTKIKKAVHWHPGLKQGSSSSSSSNSSPKSGSQQLEAHPGLRKRGSQEE